jgi:hypothetical protein
LSRTTTSPGESVGARISGRLIVARKVSDYEMV